MKTAILLTTLLGTWSAFAAPSTDTPEPKPASVEESVCVFEAGDTGKLKFRGPNREIAFERTSRACLQARITQYVRLRGNTPTTERKILFAEDCVNHTFCRR